MHSTGDASRGRMLREAALTLGAIAGTVCLFAGIAAVAFGITPLVFTSGSMEPTIETGSVALAHKVSATDVAVGDVVSVGRADGSRITHRVASIGSITGDSVVLNLKGDANSAVDPDQYVVIAADRVFFHVPYVGYFVAWLSTPFAWATGGVLALCLLWIAFAPDLRRLSEPSGRHAVAASVALVVAVASIVGIGFSRTSDTRAAVLDFASAQASVTAGSLATPTGLVCSGGGTLATSVTLTMPRPVAPVTGYQVVVRNASGSTSSAPKAFTVPATGSATVTVDGGLLGSLLGGTSYADVRSTVGAWMSVGRQTQTITSLLGMSCTGSPTSAASRQARVAEQAPSAPTESVPAASSSPSPTTSGSVPVPTPTPTPTPSDATATPPTTTQAPVAPEPVAPEPAAPQPVTPEPVVTEPAVTEPGPPPPPASAFVSSGNPKSSGGYTASVSGGSLVITDAAGQSVFTSPVSSSERYGSGAVWSSDGSLYVLSDGSATQISPVGDGTFVAGSISTGSLPSDVAALL